jgi:hypothetical protein
VPDDLTGSPRTAPPAVAPAPPAIVPVAAHGAEERPPRRPSWLRAAIWSLVILAAGVALGGAGYRFERAYLVRPPAIQRTAGGLTISAVPGRELTGLGLAGTHLIWQDGASIEYVRTTGGGARLLGPGAGMQATWDPAISDRFAVWFEAERQASVAARLVVYDTVSGRRQTLADVGSVRSYPAMSGDLAVWCSAVRLGQPEILGARVGSAGPLITIAAGDGAPVVSDGLVVWAKSWTGPFIAKEVAGGAEWPVDASLTAGKLSGIALSGRTLVWGQESKDTGSGVVSLVDVDRGGQQTLASGVSGLAGPSWDGTTAVWAEGDGTASHIMARRPGSGDAFVVAATSGEVTEVAVSGSSVAWIEKTGGTWRIVVRSLPR